MDLILNLLAIFGACLWLTILFLPWRPWSTREYLDATDVDELSYDLGDITVLIPARNEKDTIKKNLIGLKCQGKGLKIILIDDQSVDNTADIAATLGYKGLTIISGKALPSGWSGKLWALEQGLHLVKTPLILLIDADIELKPGILGALRNMLHQNKLQLASLMASLRMEGLWEKLLMPAFIYFFKLLFPFRLCNSISSKIAAAAGGCILIETNALKKIGGFRSLRGELIDDCALAARIKKEGLKIWIGLSHSVVSLRAYDHLSAIWNMVARTAFTQLNYSSLQLVFYTLILVIAFWIPGIGLIYSPHAAKYFSLLALSAMILTYIPTLRFYRIPGWWALIMPITGTLYLAMLWTSAIRYFKGKRSEWKGRVYGAKKS